MRWNEIRKKYPLQWLLVEALQAHSKDGKRILEELSIMNTYDSSLTAMKAYREVHQRRPSQEYYVLHTKWEKLEIPERRWVGIRGGL